MWSRALNDTRCSCQRGEARGNMRSFEFVDIFLGSDTKLSTLVKLHRAITMMCETLYNAMQCWVDLGCTMRVHVIYIFFILSRLKVKPLSVEVQTRWTDSQSGLQRAFLIDDAEGHRECDEKCSYTGHIAPLFRANENIKNGSTFLTQCNIPCRPLVIHLNLSSHWHSN